MHHKKTKIIATVGPATSSPQVLKALIVNGADVVRLNFSHGTNEEKKKEIDLVRQVSQELEKPIAIIADLQGPKIRLGSFEGVRHIETGEKLVLSFTANSQAIPIQFDISRYVSKGARVFINDGLLECKVLEISGSSVVLEAQNSGTISSHKGVNIPDSTWTSEVFTDKDRKDGEFAIANGVDYIALSFVQKASDIDSLRDIISQKKSRTGIIVKIEKKEAVENLSSIIKVSDAVMIARGDLAIETKAENLPILQQKIIKLCRFSQKPVIVATQMLESMTTRPRPTRAEISDVANAVLSQVDAVMLSEETATGKYPKEAVLTMQHTIEAVEENPDYQNYIPFDWEHVLEENLSFSAIVSASAELSKRIEAKAIVVATTTGRTALLLASFRPSAQIFAVTYDRSIQQMLNLAWGVQTLLVSPTPVFDTFWKNIVEVLKKDGCLSLGEKVIFVTGSTVGTSGGTDTIKVATL